VLLNGNFGSRIVRCPGCGRECVYSTENPSRPFCSPRCKNNDFGAWASEGFSVDADAPLLDEDAPDPA
jgi:endogenous inhibitor of DNA gyrase (YacG/DUF329 family)